MSDENNETFAQYFEVNRTGESPELVKMTFEHGQLNAVARHPAFAFMASQLAGVFDDAGGINYVETTLKAPDGRTFIVHLQLASGKTPHALRIEAEAELAAEREHSIQVREDCNALSLQHIERAEKAEAENAALRQALEEWRGHFGCEGPFNAYIQDGNSDPRTRVAAKAQERANQATNESAALRERVRALTEALEQWNDIGFDFWITEDEWAMREPDEDDGREWLNLSALTRAALAAAPEPPASSLLDAWTREHHARHDHQYSGAYVAEWLRKQHAPEPPADPVADAVRKCAEIADDSMFGYEANEVIRAAYQQYFAEPSASAGKEE